MNKRFGTVIFFILIVILGVFSIDLTEVQANDWQSHYPVSPGLVVERSYQGSDEVCSFEDADCVEVEESDRVAYVTNQELPRYPGAVHLTMFWMQACPHCEEVFREVLPALSNEFGDKLAVQLIELSDIAAIDGLYAYAASLGMDPNQVAAPFSIIGEVVFTGADQIRHNLRDEIEKYLGAGGVDYPQLPVEISQNSEVYQAPQNQNNAEEPVKVIFFWGDGCPHCAEAKPFLDALVNKYPSAELHAFEVWNDEANREIFIQVTKAHGFEPRFVPTILIGDHYWEGYNRELNTEIEAVLADCVNNGCPDSAKGVSLPESDNRGEQTSSGSSGPQPWLIVVVVILIGVLGYGGYTLIQKKAADDKRRRKIARKQNRRRKKEG